MRGNKKRGLKEGREQMNYREESRTWRGKEINRYRDKDDYIQIYNLFLIID